MMHIRSTYLFASALLTLGLAGCPTGELPVACEPACAAEQTCVDGVCVGGDAGAVPMPDLAMPPQQGCQPPCAAPTPFCDAQKRCVSCIKDADCPIGTLCKSGLLGATCVPGCSDDTRCANGLKCCNAQCVDTTKDVLHCGACGMACAAVHARATCAGGKCMSGMCDAPWGDCDNDPSNGCETNQRADANHCGGCGMKCDIKNAINGCSTNGCYIRACLFGFDDCNRDEKDGCESNVTADALNCGQCGKRCTVANGAPGCANSFCFVKSCQLGFADCDKDPVNGCESNTSTDLKNCGACGNVCQQNYACRGGGCTCNICNLPNASATCPNGQCIFEKCNPGYGDCNNNQGDGCEKNIFSDPANCGQCGNVCPMNLPYCLNGVCDKSPPGVLLGLLGNTEFWKVPNKGAMTDTNCRNTCKAAGLNVGCQAMGNCNYNDNLCTMSPEASCGNPMQTLSQKICGGQNPSSCPALYGVYQYMGGKWQADSTCGAEQGRWCSQGNGVMDKDCMCVR